MATRNDKLELPTKILARETALFPTKKLSSDFVSIFPKKLLQRKLIEYQFYILFKAIFQSENRAFSHQS